MKKDLVVVTGGNSGLGLEIVKCFAERGYKVLVIARTKRKEISEVFYEYGNIADEKFIASVYEKYSAEYYVKFLINNAAIGLFGSPESNSFARISKVFEAGLVGLILNTTYAIKSLNPEGSKIVNILSTASLKGNVNESLYCAQKWGARGYTESLKATFKGTNTKVISVCPGGMDTDFWTQNRDYVSVEKSNTWMKPSEVAKVVVDNVTNDNLYVSEIVIERV